MSSAENINIPTCKLLFKEPIYKTRTAGRINPVHCVNLSEPVEDKKDQAYSHLYKILVNSEDGIEAKSFAGLGFY